eukprot:m.189687 g.189687  ORF g.189687 m.189687 type:complete len:881 (+) comp18214_c1_seq1:2799-5441(+)
MDQPDCPFARLVETARAARGFGVDVSSAVKLMRSRLSGNLQQIMADPKRDTKRLGEALRAACVLESFGNALDTSAAATLLEKWQHQKKCVAKLSEALAMAKMSIDRRSLTVLNDCYEATAQFLADDEEAVVQARDTLKMMRSTLDLEAALRNCRLAHEQSCMMHPRVDKPSPGVPSYLEEFSLVLDEAKADGVVDSSTVEEMERLVEGWAKDAELIFDLCDAWTSRDPDRLAEALEAAEQAGAHINLEPPKRALNKLLKKIERDAASAELKAAMKHKHDCAGLAAAIQTAKAAGLPTYEATNLHVSWVNEGRSMLKKARTARNKDKLREALETTAVMGLRHLPEWQEAQRAIDTRDSKSLHAKHQLQDRTQHPRYKTELCTHWLMHGCCSYGKERCNFAHGEADLRKPIFVAGRERSLSESSSTGLDDGAGHDGNDAVIDTTESCPPDQPSHQGTLAPQQQHEDQQHSATGNDANAASSSLAPSASAFESSHHYTASSEGMLPASSQLSSRFAANDAADGVDTVAGGGAGLTAASTVFAGESQSQPSWQDTQHDDLGTTFWAQQPADNFVSHIGLGSLVQGVSASQEPFLSADMMSPPSASFESPSVANVATAPGSATSFASDWGVLSHFSDTSLSSPPNGQAQQWQSGGQRNMFTSSFAMHGDQEPAVSQALSMPSLSTWPERQQQEQYQQHGLDVQGHHMPMTQFQGGFSVDDLVTPTPAGTAPADSQVVAALNHAHVSPQQQHSTFPAARHQQPHQQANAQRVDFSQSMAPMALGLGQHVEGSSAGAVSVPSAASAGHGEFGAEDDDLFLAGLLDRCIEEGYNDAKTLCSFCAERERSVCLLPCAHVALCRRCAVKPPEACPICGRHVESTMSVTPH